MTSVQPYLISLAGLALLTAVLRSLGAVANATTVALVLMLGVLAAAVRYGPRVGGTTALVATLAFNFFFLAPLYTFTLDDPLNWVALAAFLAVALVAGELSSRERRRAEEAEAGRREVQRLYAELQDAFERAAEAEALRRSDQLKSALLDAVTHDLRTPLTSIKASTTALLEAPPDLRESVRRELLEVVNEETDRLDRIIGDLVALARLEAGALSLQSRWCAVQEVLDAAIDRAAGRKGRGRFLLNIDPELPAIRADARALEELFAQLFENGLRHGRPGRAPISVTAVQIEGAVEISVDDAGPGVPVADRERVFDKFHRGPGAAGGTLGLGLAIARGIAEAHGGRIHITDRPDGRRGASFVVRLPIGDEDEPAGVAS